MKYTDLVKSIDTTSRQMLGRAATVVNQTLVLRNWLIGAYIVEFEQHGEDRAKYGVRLLPRLAQDLTSRNLKGLGVSMLELMRRFYQVYPHLVGAIPQPLVTKSGLPLNPKLLADSVTTGHGIGLASTRARSRGRPARAPIASPELILSFSWSKILEFIRHDYIDLVFYHRRLRCHVLLDLKVRTFRHTDAGQMNFYLNWWKANACEPGDQPPVGILLCSDRDHTEVEFATAGMDNQLFVSRYLTALPAVEQLQRFLEADRARIEALMDARSSKPPPVAKKPDGRKK